MIVMTFSARPLKTALPMNLLGYILMSFSGLVCAQSLSGLIEGLVD